MLLRGKFLPDLAEARVAVVGSGGFVSDSAFLPSSVLMERVGNNTGNLVFQHAVSRLLHQSQFLLGFEASGKPWKIPPSVRLIVFPAANLVRPNLDLTRLVERLESVNLPLFLVGLGAEKFSRGSTSAGLHPSIYRLLALIRERSPAVSVRGEHTADVLSSLGIENIYVTGCPSNFLNPAPDFPRVIEQKLSGPLRSFIVHGGEPWPRAANRVALERRLAEWAFTSPSIYLQQSVPLLQHLMRGDRPEPDSKRPAPDKLMESLVQALLPERRSADMNQFVKAKWRSYFHVEQWLEDSSRFDFSLGGRIHGNMVAFQAGVPSLFITVDERSSELVRTMDLPSVNVANFLDAARSVDGARALAGFSAERYRARRALLWSRLKESFRLAGTVVSHPSLD